MENLKNPAYLAKILSPSQAKALRGDLAKAGQILVMTNGCFDLLHPGHLRYLAEARALGDFLLVALNDDKSIKRLKGPQRPIRPENERAEMLAGLTMVDGVTLFSEDTPLNLIELLQPDILAKGGDWPADKIVGGPETLARGGKVCSLSLVPGLSTTNLIAKILSLAKDE
ncbi:MAG: D-glycero-beta-D-manno-heptose 1-phosphate adenylyltransferase [Deltaproteobacteria bacterium]|jgi:D-beta-D-heptose 7-phosphate kinase/D-beta-D-heptose 1-phosphate adenosyltransferase|nr:D-glycero-beta-D-manno-heptose 1-phosphate adenylyltransferase [Deltaproteobacteria bacterium]